MWRAVKGSEQGLGLHLVLQRRTVKLRAVASPPRHRANSGGARVGTEHSDSYVSHLPTDF